LFARAARLAGRLFGPGKDARERRAASMERRVREAALAEQAAAAELARAEGVYGPSSAESAKATKTLASKRSEMRAARERLDRAKYRTAAALIGLDVEPHEADALAFLCGLLGLAFGIFSASLVVAAAGWSVWENVPIVISCGGLAAMAGYLAAAQFPLSAAKRTKLKSLGKSPETICYMVMSLNLVPSLERAVLFAAENGEEPLASALRKVIWDVETRQSRSVDDSFMDFAAEWSGDGEELKMALYSIRGAVSERTKEGRARVLEKATESALAGTRRRIEEFAAGLSGPTTILFALGILLPLVVGSMLPMMAIGTLDVSSLERGTATGADPRATAVATVLLMDVTFPGLAFAYAFSILGRRPGTSSPPEVRMGDGAYAWPIALGAVLAGASALFALEGSEGGLVLAALFALGAFSVPLGLHLASSASRARSERRRIAAMESEFPDALFQLGRRVSEGVPLEAAFPLVGERMGGSEIGRLFVKIGAVMSTSGLSPERALFDPQMGALREVGSRTMRASLRSAVASSGMDAQTAGKMMMDFSGYLRGLQKTERETRLQLAGVSDNMRNTATLFAPLIMGVTVGLFALLSRTFADVGEGVEMMPVWLFALVVGVYLALMVLVISHFCSRLLDGDDAVELRWRTGTALALSWLVFAGAVAVSQTAFG
jgi:Flp pilus assembly protein TadB